MILSGASGYAARGFLRVQACPFMHEVGVEAAAQGDIGYGGAGPGAPRPWRRIDSRLL